MSLSNEYMVSFKCEKGQKLHVFLHRLTPLMKLMAFGLVFPAIFFPLLFIAVGLLFVFSVAINYAKWYLIFNYNYVLCDGSLTVKKTYRFIKEKVLLKTNLTDMEECKIIQEPDIDAMPNKVECFCEQTTFQVFICIKIRNNPKNYILAADNYFYSLLKEKQ